MTRLNPSPGSLSRDDFLASYGGIYESSPWVAEGVWERARRGELNEVDSLRGAMRDVVEGAGREKQIALVRAHPELASRARVARNITSQSKAEQKGAGLDQCSPEEFAEFVSLNRCYNEKFGFPFIIAVTGLDRQGVLSAFRRRIENEPDKEFATALVQIHRIAALRLAAMAKAEQ
ncbi:MAG: 2-oxo-4-hydroxy-4-carboxy-5-ureidoimidazoline decarboxylase [Parvularculaceae bacterium]